MDFGNTYQQRLSYLHSQKTINRSLMRKIRYRVRIKNCTLQLHEDLEPGVVAQQIIEYPVDQDTPVFASVIGDDAQQLLQDTIEVDAQEIVE
jgi:hypothetical protein